MKSSSFRLFGGHSVAVTYDTSTAVNATGSVGFAANPSPGETLTLNGTNVTFVASGATGTQVNIGNNLAATLQNLITMLQASADSQLVKFTYAIGNNSLYLTAVTPTAYSTALTLAKTPGQMLISGATLSTTDVKSITCMEQTIQFSSLSAALQIKFREAIASDGYFGNVSSVIGEIMGAQPTWAAAVRAAFDAYMSAQTQGGLVASVETFNY